MDYLNAFKPQPFGRRRLAEGDALEKGLQLFTIENQLGFAEKAVILLIINKLC